MIHISLEHGTLSYGGFFILKIDIFLVFKKIIKDVPSFPENP